MSILNDLLHEIGQIFLIPCIALLLLFILLTLIQFGSVLVEYFFERRKFRANMPQLLDGIRGADEIRLRDLITNSGLLKRQKKSLLMLLNTKLPNTERVALARTLLSSEEKYYEKSTSITDLITKIGPMLGLLGTLIPLGPGVVALGEGNTAVLSESLAIAFDTTIAGLLIASAMLFLKSVIHGTASICLQQKR